MTSQSNTTIETPKDDFVIYGNGKTLRDLTKLTVVNPKLSRKKYFLISYPLEQKQLDNLHRELVEDEIGEYIDYNFIQYTNNKDLEPVLDACLEKKIGKVVCINCEGIITENMIYLLKKSGGNLCFYTSYKLDKDTDVNTPKLEDNNKYTPKIKRPYKDFDPNYVYTDDIQEDLRKIRKENKQLLNDINCDCKIPITNVKIEKYKESCEGLNYSCGGLSCQKDNLCDNCITRNHTLRKKLPNPIVCKCKNDLCWVKRDKEEPQENDEEEYVSGVVKLRDDEISVVDYIKENLVVCNTGNTNTEPISIPEGSLVGDGGLGIAKIPYEPIPEKPKGSFIWSGGVAINKEQVPQGEVNNNFTVEKVLNTDNGEDNSSIMTLATDKSEEKEPKTSILSEFEELSKYYSFWAKIKQNPSTLCLLEDGKYHCSLSQAVYNPDDFPNEIKERLALQNPDCKKKEHSKSCLIV